ncbi:MAG: hypothetical protein EOO75_18995 [Myxococcales bacterium]|nr:MAG: hypothetical protein EOO75_18995 [Myxococcales bacterium]
MTVASTTRRRPSCPWCVPTVPSPRLELIVVIPARDEAAGLADALAALADQRDAHGAPLEPGRHEVLVLANNCSDATAEPSPKSTSTTSWCTATSPRTCSWPPATRSSSSRPGRGWR